MLRAQFCRTINGGSERLSWVPEATQLKTAEPRTLSFQGRIPSSRAQGSSRSWLSLWMQRFGGLTLFCLMSVEFLQSFSPTAPAFFGGMTSLHTSKCSIVIVLGGRAPACGTCRLPQPSSLSQQLKEKLPSSQSHPPTTTTSPQTISLLPLPLRRDRGLGKHSSDLEP